MIVSYFAKALPSIPVLEMLIEMPIENSDMVEMPRNMGVEERKALGLRAKYGRFLNKTGDVIIVTKIGSKTNIGHHTVNYTIPYLRNKIKESIERLNTNSIDILLLHTTPNTVSQFIKIASFMDRLKKEQFIRLWGFLQRLLKRSPLFIGFTNRFDALTPIKNAVVMQIFMNALEDGMND